MKRKIFNVLMLICSIILYGQVTLVAETETKDLKVNQPFRINFVLEINGNEYIQESKLRLPDLSKFNILGTASNQNTYVNPKTNTVVNQVIFQCVVEPKNPGKNRIGSALVQVNGKIYKTEPLDIFVGDAEKNSLSNREATTSNEFYLNLEIKDKEVYPNQPTIAILRAFSKSLDNFRHIGSPILPHERNVTFAVMNTGKSDIEPASKGKFASQIIGVFLIFPKKEGHLEIPSVAAKIKHKNLKILSNKINLNVLKLPEGKPSEFKNAVGKYSLDLESNSIKGEINKPITIRLSIKGEGNLSDVILPKIKENGDYKVFPPKITKNISPRKNTLEGEISADYIIIPQKPGKISIETEQFAYFNPDEKEYISLGAKVLNFQAMTPEQISEAKTPLDKVNDYTNTLINTVNTPIITINKTPEKGKLNWVVILLNLSLLSGIIYLLILLKNNRKKKKSAIINTPEEPIENISETEEKLKSQQEFSIKDSLHYLDILKKENNKEKYFNAYSEFLKETENHINIQFNTQLVPYLETHFGKSATEELKKITTKISIEKYAPVSSPEEIENINSAIQELFSKIAK